MLIVKRLCKRLTISAPSLCIAIQQMTVQLSARSEVFTVLFHFNEIDVAYMYIAIGAAIYPLLLFHDFKVKS